MESIKFFFPILALFIISSCGSIKSTTSIKPNDSFILGNNEHGIFKIEVENISKRDLEIYQAPLDGGEHSSQIVKPGDKLKLKVDENTALFIKNASNDTASVKLKITGDLGLSMQYKN